jgi:molecular chaperone GrpE
VTHDPRLPQEEKAGGSERSPREGVGEVAVPGRPDDVDRPAGDEARRVGPEPGGDAAAAPTPTAALDAARAAAADLEDRLRRAFADLANLRRRCDQEIAHTREGERARVAGEWLPFVDDLERALQHAEGQPSAIVDGLRVILSQAHALLSRLGYPRFDDVGEPFDPLRHEAVGTIPADAEAGTVVAAVRPGYGSEVLLRPARVIVAQGPADG